ncbi:hypothetical protein EDD11_008538 [Mortierella claussenii]|nr:hypothetical protein EDD11_008538 [Mortierella claussenii]
MDATGLYRGIHDKVFEMIPKIGGFPGCEPWVDLDNMVELEVEGYEKRDPLHKPKAYDLQAEQQAASDTMKTLAAGILEKDRKVSEGKDREDEEAKEDEGGEEGKKMEEGNEHTTNTDLEIANEKDTAVVKNVAAVAAGESTHPMNETTTSTWKDRKVSKEEDMNIDEDSGSGWLAKGLKDEL